MDIKQVTLAGKALVHPLVVAMINHSKRSWWQARYSDGKIISEWDTLTDKIRLPIGVGGSSRWEDILKQHMVGLRLLCPNGTCAELEGPDGCHFIQLKLGYVDVGMGGGGGRQCASHIIGLITDVDGNCYCRAWETASQRLTQFTDNVFNMKYQGIGRLSLEVQGVRL